MMETAELVRVLSPSSSPYACMAAHATAIAVELAGEEVANALLGVAQLVGEAAETLQCNKQLAGRLSHRIETFVTVIVSELEAGGTDNNTTEGWHRSPSMDDFRAVLDEAQQLLQEQAGCSNLAQIFKQQRHADELRGMSERLTNSFNVLLMNAQLETHGLVDSDARPFERTLLADVEVLAIDALRSSTGAEPGDRSHATPSAPQLFFGRTAETSYAVDALAAKGPAYIAILGGPGMGKTALATTVLHAPNVVSRFQGRRYFVACDAAEGHGSCLNAICNVFGIPADRRSLATGVAGLLKRGPTILVLDNLESVWDDISLRRDTEELLALLCSMDDLSLIVTLRGSERPQGVPWTVPLLPPLAPLAEESALQAFLATSDISEQDPYLDTLLSFVECVPLALVLLGNLAQYEPSRFLVQRWGESRTQILARGDGKTRTTSLDVSIALSLTSPRLTETPDALDLLSLLSLLPRGAAELDVHLWSSDGPRAGRALSSLLRNALAYRTVDHRVRVLTPIREYMLAKHAPPHAVSLPLYTHYFALADLIMHEDKGTFDRHVMSLVTAEVDNIYFIVRYALKRLPEPRPAVRAAVCMAVLLVDVGIGSIDLIPEALAVAREAGLDELAADLLHQWGLRATEIPTSVDPKVLWTEAQSLYECTGNVVGVISTSLDLACFDISPGSVEACNKALVLAEGLGDIKRIAKCRHRLGFLYEAMGKLAEASSWYERAVEIARSLGPSGYRVLGYCLLCVAALKTQTGLISAGVAQMQDAIPILQEAQWRIGVGHARRLLAGVFLDLGRTPDAIEQLEMALLDAQASATPGDEILCLRRLSSAHLSVSDGRAAEHAVESAELLVLNFGDDAVCDRVSVLCAKGELAFWRGDLHDARAALLAADVMTQSQDKLQPTVVLRGLKAEACGILGQVEQAAGNTREACAYYLVAALILRKRLLVELVRPLTHLAHVLDDDAGDALLRALMPALHRFGYLPMRAEALLQSAKIAHRRGESLAAVHRARNALRHFEEMRNKRGCEQVKAFLEQCPSGLRSAVE